VILSRLRNYVGVHRSQLTGFLVTGSLAAGVNLALIWLLVDGLGMSSPLRKNVANVLSMESALLFQFVVSRTVVWQDRNKRSGWGLLRQIGVFHAVVGISPHFSHTRPDGALRLNNQRA
jgi:dolichol-phosphate mannosyltransferase